MKKIMALLCLMMLLAVNCFAEKIERVDKKFDFTQAKNILVVSSINTNVKNGINEFKIEDIFEKSLDIKFTKPMQKKGFTISYETNIINDGELVVADDIELLSPNDKKLQEWKSKFDIVIFAKLADYKTAVGWVDGYTYTVPEVNYYHYYDRNGYVHTVPVYTHRTEYSPGYHATFAVEKVRFDVYDLKNDKVVWSRIDERAKITKRGNLYERILKSFFGDYKGVATK
ncbi:MAG: hypothetical protein Q4D21_03945 [Phascolarctobacterium sp.]|nr:hypothetical protein [Phascolarctobacterium sp.]